MNSIKSTFIPGHARGIPSDAIRTRTIPFVISSGIRDRGNKVVNMRNWQVDNYNRNPLVRYGQNSKFPSFIPLGSTADINPDTVIGRSRIEFERNQMIAHCTFETKDVNPFAEKIFHKVLNGSLRATSLEFIEIGKGEYGEGDEAKGGKNETYYFAGQELLQWSIVAIPPNPKALLVNDDRFLLETLLQTKSVSERISIMGAIHGF